MQQPVSLSHVVDIGRCADDGVYQARVSIDTDMRLYAEVPLVALLGLVHLRIPLARTVLGRAGSRNQGGVYHGAGLEHQAIARQCGVDGVQQLDTQVVFFEKMAEPQDGALIGQSSRPRVQMSKLAIQGHIMQGFFHGRVRQSKPLLQEVDAKHGCHCARWASRLCRWSVRFNQLLQLSPRHNQIHLIEKFALARSLCNQLETGGGKAFLFHQNTTLLRTQRLAGFCRDSLISRLQCSYN